MTCELCAGNEGKSIGDESQEAFIKNKNQLCVVLENSYGDGYTEGYFDIKYCPMCGRKLDEE